MRLTNAHAEVCVGLYARVRVVARRVSFVSNTATSAGGLALTQMEAGGTLTSV